MIAVRVTLIAAAATGNQRRTKFPADAPLDAAGHRLARQAAMRLPRGELPKGERVMIGPTVAARQTAEALGLEGTIALALADCDYGRWAGASFEAIAAAEPEAIAAWLTDETAAPHDGESHRGLRERVGAWLDHVGATLGGHTIAVTSPAVIRAAIVHAIAATPRSFWRIDIAPLSQTMLSRSNDRWRLRAITPIGGQEVEP
jgi:broad specificity phosphatase PhoE